MSYYIGPVATYLSTDYHPPGITGDEFCHCVSSVSHLDLTAFLTANMLTIGASPTNIRTPALGSLVTYIALTAAQRTAAIAAGASATPSDGKCRAQAFDAPALGVWEPE